MPDDLSTLLAECRRLRRERDDLAKMCRRLAEELAAATFEPKEVAACPACGNGAAVVTRVTLKGETETVCHDCATGRPDPYGAETAC